MTNNSSYRLGRLWSRKISVLSLFFIFTIPSLSRASPPFVDVTKFREHECIIHKQHVIAAAGIIKYRDSADFEEWDPMVAFVLMPFHTQICEIDIETQHSQNILPGADCSVYSKQGLNYTILLQMRADVKLSHHNYAVKIRVHSSRARFHFVESPHGARYPDVLEPPKVFIYVNGIKNLGIMDAVSLDLEYGKDHEIKFCVFGLARPFKIGYEYWHNESYKPQLGYVRNHSCIEIHVSSNHQYDGDWREDAIRLVYTEIGGCRRWNWFIYTMWKQKTSLPLHLIGMWVGFSLFFPLGLPCILMLNSRKQQYHLSQANHLLRKRFSFNFVEAEK